MSRRRTHFVGIALSCLACLPSLAAADPQGIVEPPEGFGGSPGSERSTQQPGTQVAMVELGAPAQAEFILRATIPIPPGIYPRPDGAEVFSVLGRGGELIPAQLEVVSLYPDPADGADIVEVIAAVDNLGARSPGERIEYSIVWDLHRSGNLRVASSVEDLLREEGALTARTADVFGHGYTCDLVRGTCDRSPSRRVLRQGRYVRQLAGHGWLRPAHPVGGDEGTLPHMMGLHTYFTLYDQEEFFSLDLRVHNGGSGLDQLTDIDDPLGDIYFEDLRLRLPEGWKVLVALQDPFFGAPRPVPTGIEWPILRRMGEDRLHLLPSQAQFERRLVICRDDPEIEARARVVLLEQGLAFVRRVPEGDIGELFSWWNRDTARYFPQNVRLPDFTFLDENEVRDDLENRFVAYRHALEQGTLGPWPILSTAMGWCHPWGTRDGGMQSGDEIFFYDGVRTLTAASNEGYRLHQLTQRMYTCRHPVALFNKDGAPTRVEDWLTTAGNGLTYLPPWVFLRPVLFLGDPFGFLEAPTFQREAVAAQGREPSYQQRVLAYEAIDIQHLVRYTRSLKALAWLGNDALAKDDLRLQAELMRLSYSPYPQAPDGHAIVTGMYKDLEFVDSHPGEGFDVSRGEGWLLDTVTASYRLADPGWRADVRPWLREVVELFSRGQEDCTGVIGSVPNFMWYGGRYRMRQSISESIIDNALWGMQTSVFAHEPATRNELRRIVANSGLAAISPGFWNDAMNSPWFLASTGPFDPDQPSYCAAVPPPAAHGWDDYQTWCSMAYSYWISGNQDFLLRADQMSGGNLWAALTQDGYGLLENRVPFLLLMQERNGY